MKKITFLVMFLTLLFLPIQIIRGQEYVSLVISSGFSEDVIAETSPAGTTTSSAVDATGTGANNAFMSINYLGATVGLPANGLINSIASTTPGLVFQLASYTEDNSLRINSNGGTGTLVFQNPQSALQIFILATSGSAASNFTGVITFTDNSTQTISSQTVPDWYQTGTNPAAILGIGRVSRSSGNPDNNATNPKLFQIAVAIDMANQTKLIESISFTKTSSDTGFLNIFGVSAEITPDCPKPTGFTMSDVSAAGATFGWTSLGTDFEIKYGPTGFDVETAGASVDLTTFSYNLTDVTEGQTYDVYIRRDCDAEGFSNWTEPITFTAANQVTIGDGGGNTNGTGNDPIDDYYNSMRYQTVYTAAELAAAGLIAYNELTELGFSVSEGTNTALLNYTIRIGHTSASNASSHITPTDLVTVRVAADYLPTVVPAGEFDMITFDTNFVWNGVDNIVIDICTGGSNPYSSPYGGVRIHSMTNGSRFIRQDISGNLCSTNTDSTNDNRPQIRFSYEEGASPSCLSPTSLTSTNITSDSAVLGWTSGGTLFDIKWGEADFDLETEGTLVAGFSNGGTLSDLDSNTNYSFYVRRDCGEDDGVSSWSGPFSFRTLCGVVGAFVENFNSVELYTLPYCWSAINDYSDYCEIGVIDYNGVNDSNSLNVSFNNYTDATSGVISDDIIIISPQTENLGSGEYRVKFKIGGYDAKVSFGTISTDSDGSTFEAIETFDVSSSDLTDKVYNIALTENDYFAFKLEEVFFANDWWSYASGRFWIDNVIYEPIPSCQDLSNDVSSSINYSANSALISWTAIDETQTSFDIEYGPVGFVNGTGTLIQNVGNPYTLTDLVAGTTYDVYVRANCGDDDLGVWTEVHTFLFDYCDSIPTSNDNQGITNFVLNEFEIEIPDTPYYEIEDVIEVYANEENISSLTFSTGYTYDFHYWIDLNKDGVFDNDTEKVFTGVSTVDGSSWDFVPSISEVAFQLGDVPSGVYKMRIGSADTGQSPPNPCYSGSFGVTLDLNVEVIGNCKLPDPVVIADITDERAVVSWAETLFVYDMEYGPAGFTPGTGTLVENVQVPYEITGLTSNTQYDVRVVLNDCDGETLSSTTMFTAKCSTPLPVGTENQIIISDLTVAEIEVEGDGLRYYTDEALTQEVSIDDLIQQGVYYITQTWDCESPEGLMVNVTARPRTIMPIVDSIEYVCDSATLNDLDIVFLPNAIIKWYASETGDEVLPSNTVVESGVEYYVTQSDAYSESYRSAVNVEILETPDQVVAQEVTVCHNTALTQIDLQTGNSGVRWYFNQTSTTALGVSAVAQNNTYYVTTFNGICESARIPVVVNVVQQLQMPTAATQNFCGSGTVSQLTATGAVSGAEYSWYNSATSTTPLQPTAALQNGTYYVSQKLTNCESPRRPVTVKVTNLTAPTATSFEFCGSATVADLSMPVITGITYNWYLPNQTTPLAGTANLVTGNYLVSKAQNGCESTKTIVQVTIKPRPASPTGSLTQNFIDSAMISDLVMDQSNVIWYVTYEDALNGNNPLQTNIPIEDDHIYYGVLIGSNGCASLPTAVTATITLGVKDLDLASLKYYPNPVDSELTISYKEQIKLIEIYDLLGKQIKVQKFDSNDIRVNVSGLSSGTYMFRVQTNTGSQFIKIIKK